MNTNIAPRIFFFWAQGRETAPKLAQQVWAKWEALNPDFSVEILNLDDAKSILSDYAIDYDQIGWAALSDILRIALLARSGGIWCDSSVIPTKPIQDWLPASFGPGGLFAFKWNQRIRPASSWFLASEPQAYLTTAWRDKVRAYWSVPRALNPEFVGGRALSDAAFKSMGFDGGERQDAYPYFWLHHLFGDLIESDPVAERAWAKMPDYSALPPHALDRWLRADALPLTSPRRYVKRAMMPLGYANWKTRQLMSGSPVHKLNFKRSYRPKTLQRALQWQLDI